MSPEPLLAESFVADLTALSDPNRSGKAEAGFRSDNPDDRFLAVPMRAVFALAKQYTEMDLDQIELLLDSPVHEVRVGAVSIMDFQARRSTTPEERREELYKLYLHRHDRIDNWDLVDRTAPSVVGGYLHLRSRDPLYQLARSSDPMRRRTAIVATYHLLRHGQLDDTFGVAELLLDDDHDLVQKAVGGWLREAGKRDVARLRAFLDLHAPTMGRTALRYAVEHLDAETRRHYRKLQPSPDGSPPSRRPAALVR